MEPVLAVDGTVFAVVVVGAVALGVVVAVLCGLAGGDAYDHIGRGGLWSERARRREAADTPDQRDEEIRQLLGARRDRRARRGAPAAPPGGEPPPPAEAEPEVEAGLDEEVRQLAVARNARRRRQGLEPLDVEAEVARRLRDR